MTHKMLPPLLYKGSVKNVRGKVSDDFLIFEYSDRYSIFDWGEMPDQIADKGKALNLMGAAFFKLVGDKKTWSELFKSPALKHFDQQYLSTLQTSSVYQNFCQKGLTHHFKAVVNDECSEVKNIKVVRPEKKANVYNYEKYQDRLVNTLVPLEVIFRLGLAPGNSLSKRFKAQPHLMTQFGLDSIPAEGTLLNRPCVDFSTKLENGDRYLTYAEAQRISGMSSDEFLKLRATTELISLCLYAFHAEMDLELWDGKVEFAFVQGEDLSRDFMLVDSIGIDELRLISESRSLSKEFLREVYKNTPWHIALSEAKKEAITVQKDFREICKNKYNQSPEPLSAENKEKAQSLYKSYCNSVYQLLHVSLPFENRYTVKNYLRTYL